MSVFADITVPSGGTPAKGSFWDTITGPLMPLVDGLVWFTFHVIAPGVLFAAIIAMLIAGGSGNKPMMMRARAGIMSVPGAVALGAVAVILGNYLFNSYS